MANDRIKQARDAGYTDDEIVEFLSARSDDTAQRIQQARQAGYDNGEIVRFLESGRGYDRSGGTMAAAGRGAVTEPTNLLGMVAGAPVSTATMLAQTLLGGSDYIPEVLQSPSDPSAPLFGVTDMQARFRGGVNSMNIPRRVQEMSGGPVTRPNSTYESIQDLPPEERGPAQFGGVVGASLAPGLGLVGAARPVSMFGAYTRPALTPGAITGEGTMANIGRELITRAGQTPNRFMAVEGVSALGAAGGGEAGAGLAPDSTLARMGGEMIGGIAAPGVLASRLIEPAINQYTRAAARFGSAEGQMDSLAQSLQQGAQDLGENPAELAANLRATNRQNVESGVEGLSSAQTVDSAILMAAEGRVREQNVRAGINIDRAGNRALEGLRTEIDDLVASGDPASLQRALVLRRQYFDEMIDQTLAHAQRRVTEVMERLGPEPTQAARQAASQEAAQVIDQALRQARRVESQLWEEGLAALPDTPMPATATAQAYREVRRQMREEVNLPDGLDATLRRLVDDEGDGGMMTPQMLHITRSDLLDAARNARGQGQNNLAGKLDQLAQAALDDLMELGGESLTNAREYSTSLNNRFTRGFGGSATGVNQTGGVNINPEVMLDAAFAGRNASVNARELQQGAEFGGEAAGRIPGDATVNVRGTDYSVDPSLGPRMQQAQEDFLRASSALVRNADGTIDPAKLQRFLRDNEVSLQRFPELRAQLQDVESATRTFNQVGEDAITARRALEQEAFSRASGFESATDGVGTILSGRFPVRDYGQLARVAASTGDDALGGLRTATLDWARQNATDARGNFSFDRFADALLRPQREGQPPLLELMVRNGVTDYQGARAISRMLRQAEQIEAAARTGRGLADLIDNPSAWEDFALRVSGARIGTAVGSMAPGPIGNSGLIIAQAGSSAMRRLMQKIPAGRQMELLERAARDPEFMAAMLERVPAGDAARQAFRQRQINGFLIQAGLLNGQDAMDNDGG